MRKRIWRILPQVCSLLGRTPEFSAEKVCSLFVPVHWDSQIAFSLLEANKLGAVTSCYFSTLNGIRHLYVHIDCFHMFFVIKAISGFFPFFLFGKRDLIARDGFELTVNLGVTLNFWFSCHHFLSRSQTWTPIPDLASLSIFKVEFCLCCCCIVEVRFIFHI